MPLVHSLGEATRSVGTCFVISRSGLAITARHVVEDAWPYEADQPTPLSPDRHGTLDALYVDGQVATRTPDTVAGARFPVSYVWFKLDLDIAILQLDLGIGGTATYPFSLTPFRLSPGIPKSGQACYSFGYHSMRWDSDAQAKTHHIFQSFSATTGEIEEIHFPRRDWLLKFPCCLTSARFESGMSGGPVLSADGQVFGVACCSFTKTGDIAETSYVSLVGPALATNLRQMQPDGDEERICLFELLDRGVVLADETYNSLRISKNARECVIDFIPA